MTRSVVHHRLRANAVSLYHADCRDALRRLPDACIDSVVTDPPYALVSIVKRFGGKNSAPAQHGKDGLYARASAGFMGKTWDTGETAFAVEFWEEVLRVLKPGGHVLAFSGTRTQHRLVCAIEDAGFEIRDQIGWLYGTGFPKNHAVRGIDEFEGWGTALKPAWEPICVARKPLIGTVAANMLEHRTGAINIAGCRIDYASPEDMAGATPQGRVVWPTGGNLAGGGIDAERKEFERPALTGRFPANIIHDGSDEVIASFPADRKGFSAGGRRPGQANRRNVIPGIGSGGEVVHYGDNGSAARFFYSAKASKADRAGSKHPTVKPVDLMRYLCRLVTPPGGIVLDPFAGSGTTLVAAELEGFKVIGCEREDEYVADIARRFDFKLETTAAA